MAKNSILPTVIHMFNNEGYILVKVMLILALMVAC